MVIPFSIYLSSLQLVSVTCGGQKMSPVLHYSVVYLSFPLRKLSTSRDVWKFIEGSLTRPNWPKLARLAQILDISAFSVLCVICCSQESFFLESIYLHYRWCKCPVVAVKLLPILHYSVPVVYIFLCFVIIEPIWRVLKIHMRLTDVAWLAGTSLSDPENDISAVFSVLL